MLNRHLDLPGSTLADRAAALLEQQKLTWPMLRDNYDSLAAVETRMFDFGHFAIRVQFNPRRITSSAAKVDPKSIQQRKCFLCPAHLPLEQRGIALENDYLLLCNPFPIFPEHFTIPHIDHTPQRIDSSFDAMLRLAKDLSPRYMVFYNGPRCGASAPDHLHFQAGNRSLLPIEQEYEALVTSGRRIALADEVQSIAVSNCLRHFIALESGNAASLSSAFARVHETLRRVIGGDDEPMLNILASYDAGRWRIIIFPRGRHRPSVYFAEGDAKMLLSPASVDFGGVVITPLGQDFARMSKEVLTRMFAETTLEDAVFDEIVGLMSPLR